MSAVPASALARLGNGAAGPGHHMAPTQPKRDLVESLFMHCDLAADAYAVGNVRNCLLHAVPVEGHFGRVLCYQAQCFPCAGQSSSTCTWL